LKNNLTYEQLYEAYEFHELKSLDLIEKDWHVIKALSALSSINDNPTQGIKLIFGGGTALSRAHGIVHRMSEDIDFKIVSDKALTKQQLREFRELVGNTLKNAGFELDINDEKYCVSRNKSRYTKFTIPYQKLVQSTDFLRPEIQIEISVYPLRNSHIEKQVQSFVASAFNEQPEVSSILCSSVVEIAAEKFVALTRRAGEEQSDPSFEKDKTLVRHIYDLHVARNHYKFEDLIILAKDIMVDDASTRAAKFTAYRDNPVQQTILAINGIESDHHYAEKYSEFCKAMVYAKDTVSFEDAITTLNELATMLSDDQNSRPVI